MDASDQPCIEVSGAADATLAQWLCAELARAAAALPAAGGGRARVRRLSVRIVGDAEMSRLHVRHSGIEGTTDVLTFPQGTPRDGLEVDAAVCADEAARRCAEFGHGVREELLLYGVHALLHAAGFDDATPGQHAQMHAEEDRLLTSLGHGALYSGRRRVA